MQTAPGMVFRFKSAAHFRAGFNREAGAARLAQLLERDGSLERDAIIADGLQPESPLHPQFDIAPDEALRAAYEREADYLRRNFVTIVKTEGGEPREIRAVVPVRAPDAEEDEPRRYVATVFALADPFYRPQVLDQALAEFVALRRKYADLKELSRIHTAIDKMAESRAKAVELKKAA